MGVLVEEQGVPLSQDGLTLPPTPPETVVDEDSKSEEDVGKDSVTFTLPPPSTEPTRVLDVDKATPDAHVPRDERLIRLTGVHPFNVEAPLTALFKEGFLTSPELFYVRNHGAVPDVQEKDIPDWEFSVEGFVQSLHMTNPKLTPTAAWSQIPSK
jgi:nitrate reductase (NAD(P)H)